MKRITIYDVAKEADVSLATVSRVINGSEVVREDTRIKVQEAIEKLGYKPNAIAQGLALQKTTTIAIVMPAASFFYTGQIINGLLDTADLQIQYHAPLHICRHQRDDRCHREHHQIACGWSGDLQRQAQQRGAQHAQSLQCADRRHRK